MKVMRCYMSHWGTQNFSFYTRSTPGYSLRTFNVMAMLL